MIQNLQRRAAPFLYVLVFFAGFFAACLWFNPQAYLQNLAPTLAAVALTAAAWVVYLAVSAKVSARNEWLRREKTVQREKVHPVLHASLHASKNREMLVLSVQNHGKGMAKHIRLSVLPLPGNAASEAVVDAMAKLPAFSGGIDMLASGEEFKGMFADLNDLILHIPHQEFSGIVRLKTDCENAFGELCSSETVLELSLLNR
ncbi:hypothetical protein [Neisseria chenwenguii]|uniref:Uncharacterized protein n=1 Tax=Neisseria chenwenguii TaxID=1853278 RepID=A0A220S5I0_9NEIS|nr:hypothetical protein [Neisseria chenwenguii]ASK28485.1 hypothetical protein BG910_06210 [Neisseria chenwenguii]ROV57064.1 hypothetical protein EGS38_01980 [Neisseria chenwenguii]